jgi:hypothetical protein
MKKLSWDQLNKLLFTLLTFVKMFGFSFFKSLSKKAVLQYVRKQQS